MPQRVQCDNLSRRGGQVGPARSHPQAPGGRDGPVDDPRFEALRAALARRPPLLAPHGAAAARA
ncbi:MAG TPA: hypothetical protein VHG91_06645, partial [Longimicrobium sp.]|nr:hypothetical protein [Longimicrobium sp.]